jgi:CTP:molybdopterin cytidylyltransferase MocA
MVLIVCMAGLNTRFHNVGFDIPKYLLPWKNSTIIAAIIKNPDIEYKSIILYPEVEEH